MVSIHTWVSCRDRDVGLRVLVPSPDMIITKEQGEGLLVGKDILNHRE